MPQSLHNTVPMMIKDPIAHWHHIVESRDADLLDAWLDDDVVFLSPVIHTPQQGKAITTFYLAAAMQVLGNEHFRYVREIVGPQDAMLEFKTEVNGIEINGVDILHWNNDNRITEFKVMVRPLKAIQLLHAQMKAALSQ